ncbi:unnamed protein product [Absidia cylindrospora]
MTVLRLWMRNLTTTSTMGVSSLAIGNTPPPTRSLEHDDFKSPKTHDRLNSPQDTHYTSTKSNATIQTTSPHTSI